MPTGKEIVAQALTCKGDAYIFGVEVPASDPDPKAEDCSELVEWGCARQGVSPKMPDGTWYQIRHCRDHGLLIPVEQAIQTPGALLFYFSSSPFDGGRPDMAHVAISQGNGKTIEARSTKYGVGEFPSAGRNWTHAALIPGVDYESEDQEVEPAQDEPEGPQLSFRVTATSGLHIRSGPGTDYEEWGDLACGQEILAAKQKSPDPAWLPILLENDEIGWVARAYVDPVVEAATPDKSVDESVDGSADFSTKEGTIAAIKAECQQQGIGLPAQIAYVMATVEWETGHTFKPVKEAYWKSEEWRQQNLSRYYPYYGRGYVQLTWKDNYQKYAGITGLNLVGYPDLAMEPKTALFVLVHGFKTGAFTGKKITDYIDAEGYDFHNCRRCINGVDKAEEIAALAEKYLEEIS
jgi:predicted chitinase/cell wall-associated NlpC family hydrolase